MVNDVLKDTDSDTDSLGIIRDEFEPINIPESQSINVIGNFIQNLTTFSILHYPFTAKNVLNM